MAEMIRGGQMQASFEAVPCLLALQQRLGWTCKDVEDNNLDNNLNNNPDNNLDNNLDNNFNNDLDNNIALQQQAWVDMQRCGGGEKGNYCNWVKMERSGC